MLHCGRQLPITVTLANIISKSFPEEYQERKEEDEREMTAAMAAIGGPNDGLGADGTLSIPLFGEYLLGALGADGMLLIPCFMGSAAYFIRMHA